MGATAAGWIEARKLPFQGAASQRNDWHRQRVSSPTVREGSRRSVQEPSLTVGLLTPVRLVARERSPTYAHFSKWPNSGALLRSATTLVRRSSTDTTGSRYNFFCYSPGFK